MKSLYLHLILPTVLFCSSIIHIQAQCPGGLAPVTITYDTVGTGTGNDSYLFTVPKFDPALGTLTSVTISSAVQVNYIYSIGNTRISSAVYRTRILRTDDIASSALDPAAISAANQTALLTTLVPGNTTIQVGPSIMNYTVSDIVNDGRVVNFMGVGNVDFAYDNTSFVAFSGPSGSNVDFTQLNDTLHFSVSYTYCAASLLNANLFNFAAIKNADGSCQLNWQQLKEEQNKRFTVQFSSDGNKFSDIAEMPANHTGTYNYFYAYTPGSYKQLFFRIKKSSYDNSAFVYSEVRAIYPGAKNGGGMHVYPTNPTNTLQLAFNTRDDRKIVIYAMTGRQVWSNIYQRSTDISIAIPASLQKGTYLVTALNLNTQQTEAARIIIQ